MARSPYSGRLESLSEVAPINPAKFVSAAPYHGQTSLAPVRLSWHQRDMIVRMTRSKTRSKTVAWMAVSLLISASIASAQPKRATVDAQLNFKALHAGDRAAVAVVVDVEPGYHAQSHTPLEKFLIPLTVKIDPAPAIEPGDAIYPDPVLEDYPALGKV